MKLKTILKFENSKKKYNGFHEIFKNKIYVIINRDIFNNFIFVKINQIYVFDIF